MRTWRPNTRLHRVAARWQSQWSNSEAVFQRLTAARQNNPNWANAFAETLSEEQISEGTNPAKRRGSTVGKFVIGVSDDIDVAGFSNRFGVNSSLVHTSPSTDHPFVEWIRSRGATVLGKVRLTSPFGLTESLNYDDCPAAFAVTSGVCDLAVITSLYGVAGSNAPSRHSVVTFAPSASTFPRGQPPWTRYRSLGLTFRDLQALSSFWEHIAGGNVAAAGAASGTDVDENDPVQPPPPSVSRFSALCKYLNLFSSSKDAGHLHVKKKSSDAGGLVVGVPEDWIEACFQRKGTGRDFLYEVQRLMAVKTARSESLNGKTKARSIEVREMSWSASPDDLLACATTIVNYELASALKEAHMDGTGLLDQLPKGVVSAIFEGKRTSEAVYRDALNFRSELSREYIDEAAEVDCVVLPTSSPPHNGSHNLRSGLVRLPVALSRSPSISMQMQMAHIRTTAAEEGGIIFADGGATGKEVAVMFSSEPGMDSALIDTVLELHR